MPSVCHAPENALLSSLPQLLAQRIDAAILTTLQDVTIFVVLKIDYSHSFSSNCIWAFLITSLYTFLKL